MGRNGSERGNTASLMMIRANSMKPSAYDSLRGGGEIGTELIDGGFQALALVPEIRPEVALFFQTRGEGLQI